MVEDSWQAGRDHTPKRRLGQISEIEHMTIYNPKSAPEIAAQLIANGYQPVPIPYGQKGPRIPGWQDRNFKPTDFAVDANIGIRCGDGAVAFCDIDVYCPETAKAVATEWLRRFPAPHRNWMQRTGQPPKTGFLFRLPHPIAKITQKIAPTGYAPEGKDDGIEILCNGQQVVAFGIHPDTQKPYQWHGFDPTDFMGSVDDLPAITREQIDGFLEWLCNTYGPQKPLSVQAAAAIQPPTGHKGPVIDLGGPSASYTSTGPAEAEARELLGHLDPDMPYCDWLSVLMALHDAGDYMLPLAVEWSSKGSKFRPGEIEQKWRGFTRGSGVGWATIPAMARDRGAKLDEISIKHRAYDCRPHSAVAAQKISGSEEIELILNKRGHPAWCAENACLILETTPDWEGALAYNEETALTLLLRPIPGSKTPKASFKPRPITEADLIATLRWFNRNGFPDATRNTVADAVFATAAQSVIAPVRHYLEALSWDGVERITTWLSAYGGADDQPITRRMGRAWMISAVARALKPGCKADCALILEGGQGVGKSSAARVLASEDWFSDSLRDLDSKDAAAALRGRWIIELPELSAMKRSEVETVKAYLSRTEERYRPAYGRTEVIEPRRCVFIGTTNRTDYLNDDTGNRRFWPVSIKRFDLDALRRDRDQLWAEAVTTFRAGEAWWLDREAETEAAALTSQRQADDPWESKVLEAVIGKGHTSTREMLDAIGLDTVHRTKADSMRVAGILNRAGWVRDGKYSAGLDRGQARYVRPPSEEPQRGTS